MSRKPTSPSGSKKLSFSTSADDYELAAMRIEDYVEVVALWETCAGLGSIETRDEIVRYLDRNPGLSQVARWRGHLVAAVLAGHDGRRGYLYHLAVALDHRRHGLARRIIDRCLQLMSQLGLPRCGLQVYCVNEAGLEFWRRAGWTERVDVQPFTHDL